MTPYDELMSRHARAMCLTDDPRCADGCIPNRGGECHYLDYARASRESDEANGVVSVPVESTEGMIEAVILGRKFIPTDASEAIQSFKRDWQIAIAAGAIRREK